MSAKTVSHALLVGAAALVLGSMAAPIAVNVTRISLMGLSRSYYEAIHSQWGDLVTNSTMLVPMIGVSVLGARRELFSHA